MNNRCSGFMWLSISSIINSYRLSMPIDQLIVIDWFSFFMRFIFSQDFQKHGLFMHFNDENCDKTLIFFHNGDWYIVENMGIQFYDSINFQLGIKLMNCDETVAKNNQYTPGQLSLQWTIFIFCPVYFVHLCCDKQVIKWLLKPIHVVSGLFYYSSV